MGINYPDASPNDEQPVYTVHVDAFFIDKNEVTNAEYKQFLIENPQWQKELLMKDYITAIISQLEWQQLSRREKRSSRKSRELVRCNGLRKVGWESVYQQRLNGNVLHAAA